MPAKNTSIVIGIGGDASGIVDAVDLSDKALDELIAKANKANHAVAGGGKEGPTTFGEQIRAKFLKDRQEGVMAVERLLNARTLAAEGIEKIVGSGVAAAGVVFAAESFSHLGESIKGVGESALEGHASYGSMAKGLIESIPIVGSVFSGFINLRQGLKDIATSATKTSQAYRDAFAEMRKATREAFAEGAFEAGQLNLVPQAAEIAAAAESNRKADQVAGERFKEQQKTLKGKDEAEARNAMSAIITQNEENLQKKVADINLKWARLRGDQSIAAQRTLGAAVSKAQQEQLKEQDDNLGASLAAIDQKLTEQRNKIAEKLQQANIADPKNTPANQRAAGLETQAAKIEAGIEIQKAYVDAAMQAIEKTDDLINRVREDQDKAAELNKKRAEDQLVIEQDISRFKLESLKSEGTAYSALEQQQLRINELTEEYHGKRLAIAKALENENATFAQRAQLTALSIGTLFDEAAAIKAAKQGHGNFTGGAGGNVESHSLSGAGANAKARSEADYARNNYEELRKSRESLEQMKRYLEKIANAFASFGIQVGL